MKVMNDKFDELAKGMAPSVTRRGALKKFGLGLAGIVLATLGLSSKAETAKPFHCQCHKYQYGCPQDDNLAYCVSACTYHCQKGSL